ncbi:tripartite tricarboxylate transporter substrate binding protein [Hydrogenophaga sp.]|uniref:Bug family tripartite tricarboxylate transporter substrate binding protein n=1 Tax=Hydrogenophaga sp. TaxID=1904254 RepID=UPI00271B5233|nr:tripartite tricarboxylate transporter substrate binding protein [Hydrogenophaga sp.]MDO9436918.1 tripartite tricarboxylate transporter substrate binding protein [Hydrogenophaga sp.]
MNFRHPLRRQTWRRVLALLLMAGIAPTLWAADAFPTKTITLIVNGGAGSLPDNFARPLAERLRQTLGQAVVIDNKPGAGGLVALQALKSAAPDGHTLAIVTNAHMVWNPFVFPKLTYDPQTDLLPVSPIALIPMALVVNPKVPAQSLEQLVALAEQKPGVLNYASSSNGSPPHVLFELFKAQSGSRIVHIPFRTGPDALTSVIAGDTQIYLAGTSLVEPMVKDGRLRVLAVSPSVKSPTFANVPTFADKQYTGFESAVWLGVVTNAGVPANVVERLNREIGQLLQDPALQKVFESQGSLPYHASPAAFAQRIAQDRALWTPVLQKLDLKPN